MTPEKEEDEAPEPVVVEVPVVVEEPEEAMPAVDESAAVEVPEEVMPAPEPFAVDDAATEEVPAIPAPDVDVTAMEEEEVHLDEAAATTLEPTIEPVAEETAADGTMADKPVAEENDADVFTRPESPRDASRGGRRGTCSTKQQTRSRMPPSTRRRTGRRSRSKRSRSKRSKGAGAGAGAGAVAAPQGHPPLEVRVARVDRRRRQDDGG